MVKDKKLILKESFLYIYFYFNLNYTGYLNNIDVMRGSLLAIAIGFQFCLLFFVIPDLYDHAGN